MSNVKISDGYSSNKLAAVLNTTPSGMEYALAVRIIGGATITGGGTSSLFLGAFPPSGTAAGFTDGVDMKPAWVYNTNFTSNNEYTLGVNLRASGESGSIEIGTTANPLIVNSTVKAVIVNLNLTTLPAGPTYILGIDLDNKSGRFKHINNTSIKLVGFQITTIRDALTDTWDINAGALLSATPSNATIGWLQPASISLIDTNSLFQTFSFFPEPLVVDLTVSGGDYTVIGDSDKETTAGLNNASQLPDPFTGTPYTISPGDLIFRITRTDGVGNLTFKLILWYYVV